MNKNRSMLISLLLLLCVLITGCGKKEKLAAEKVSESEPIVGLTEEEEKYYNAVSAAMNRWATDVEEILTLIDDHIYPDYDIYPEDLKWFSDMGVASASLIAACDKVLVLDPPEDFVKWHGWLVNGLKVYKEFANELLTISRKMVFHADDWERIEKYFGEPLYVANGDINGGSRNIRHIRDKKKEGTF